MSLSVNLYSSDAPVATAEKHDGHVWVSFRTKDSGGGLSIFLPASHPDAFEAAQTMALAYNSVAKPKLAKIA